MQANSISQSTKDIVIQLSNRQRSLEEHLEFLKRQRTNFVNELTQQIIIKMNSEVLFSEKDCKLNAMPRKIEGINNKQEVAESTFRQLSGEVEKIEKMIEIANISQDVASYEQLSEMVKESGLLTKA